MKVNKEYISKYLMGSLSKEAVQGNSELTLIFNTLDKNSDGNIDLEEITLFANQIIKSDENGNGKISNKELENTFFQHFYIMGIDGKQIKKFLKVFADNKTKSGDNVMTPNPDGSYSVSMKKGNITRKINFDNKDNYISLEEITEDKIIVRNKDNKLIKTIEKNGDTTITSEYDEMERITSKKSEKDNTLIAYKEYTRNGNNYEREDIYTCENGIKSENPTSSIIKEYGKVSKELIYDKDGNIISVTDYEQGKIKSQTTGFGTKPDSRTEFMGSYDYFQQPEYKMDKKIDYTKQGEVGDCWLLSGLSSLHNTTWGRKAIEDCIEIDSETGDVTITLKGAYGKKKKFTVTNEELDSAIANQSYSSGDKTVLAFEIAIAKYRKQYGEEIDGGYESEIYRLILGNSNTQLIENKVSIMEILKKAEKDPDKYIISPCFKLYDSDNDHPTFHAYNFKRIETDETGDKYVIFTNPWNARAEIRMEYKEFVEKVDNIEYLRRPQNLKSDNIEEIDSDSSIGDIKMSQKTNKSASLAVISAYANSKHGQERMKEIIHKDSNGNIIINLQGQQYPIDKYAIATAKATGYYSEGDDDVIALELAVERYHSRQFAGDNISSTDLYTGMERIYYSSEMISILEGKAPKIVQCSDNELESTIEELYNNPDMYMATGCISDGYQQDNCTIKRIEKNEFGEYIIVITRPEDTSIEIKYTIENFRSIYKYINIF